MLGYSEPSSDFISSKVSEEFTEYLFVPIYNLSCILGDDEGTLSSSITNTIIRNVRIKAPGVLYTIGEDILSSPTEYDHVLGQDPFYTEMGYPAYLTYRKIRRGGFAGREGNKSPLLEPIGKLIGERAEESGMPVALASALCFVYVSCFDLYLQLLDYSDSGELNTSKLDIKSLESNIRWISSRLDPNTHFNLLTVIRELHRMVLTISGIGFLFRG